MHYIWTDEYSDPDALKSCQLKLDRRHLSTYLMDVVIPKDR